MRLFLDVDDTLVLWQYETEPSGLFTLRGGPDNAPYLANHALIGAVACYLAEHPDTTLHVWSGGGMAYALDWAVRLLHTDGRPWPNLSVVPKYVTLPEPGDIVIDDQQLGLAAGVTLYTWQDFLDAA